VQQRYAARAPPQASRGQSSARSCHCLRCPMSAAWRSVATRWPS